MPVMRLRQEQGQESTLELGAAETIWDDIGKLERRVEEGRTSQTC